MKAPTITLVAAIVFLAGLGVIHACASRSEANSWLHFRSPNDLVRPDWQEVPSSRVHPLTSEAASRALSLLADHDYVVLTAEEARGLDIPVPLEANLVRYLVRAVKNPRANGAYKVFSGGGAIVVRHESLSKHTTIERDGLVVDLQTPPTALFVEVSIAE